MKIVTIATGPLGENSLIVPLEENRVFIVDPASCAFSGDEKKITSYLAANSLKPAAVILTHGHFDHVAGLPFLKKCFPNLPILIHKDDSQMIGANSERIQSFDLAMMGFEDFIPSVSNLPDATNFLEDGKTLADCLEISDSALAKWKVIHTPGHTKGSCCFYNRDEKILIAGDTIFYRSWGRTDLFGGSEEDMEKSLAKVKKIISPDTMIYSGHEYSGFKAADGFPV